MTAQSNGVKFHLYEGLSSDEVEARRSQYGRNVLTPPKREAWWKLFLGKFDDPVIRILIIAAILAIGVGFVHGEYVEGLGIIIAVLLATTLSFLNEYKATKEFDLLNQVNDDVPIKVIRDKKFITVPRRDLVVGDVIIIEHGEELPTDGAVLESVCLRVDESKFTGESISVIKLAQDDPQKGLIKETAYPVDKVLRSTMIVDGHGVIEVSAVGDNTEIGKTARAASELRGEPTPLNKQLEGLSKLIGVLGFGIAGLTYIALIVRGIMVKELILTGHQWLFSGFLMAGVFIALMQVWLPILCDGIELLAGKKVNPQSGLENKTITGWFKTIGLGIAVILTGVALIYLTGFTPKTLNDWLPAIAAQEFLKFFMIAVTLIVVAVPEGLAMSVTLSLAYSMRKMTASNNLVRRMHACETIGAATVICTDKTGTLTMNEMRVKEAEFPCLKKMIISKEIKTPGEKLIFEAISANSTANLTRHPGKEAKPIGNPTEGALLLWLEDNGLDYLLCRSDFRINYQWTFTTERKFMATMGISPSTGRKILHLKGAPEIIFSKCSKIFTDSGVILLNGHEAGIKEAIKGYQARAMRTLAFAYRELPDDFDLHDANDIEKIGTDMIWLGFVAIADPVRPEVPKAIRTCKEAGVKVKMVTGDNQETGREIARQIGLLADNEVNGAYHLTGQEFENLSDEKAKEVLVNLKILSRARPLQKMRMVRLLQMEGEVVAVTGDGTNDAPALNHANVGIAMGTGTSVAKEASDIILLDDSFNSIVNAVMWGRSVYQNIQRFILFQLTINVAAIGIAFLGPFLGVKLPLTVIQMLWVNLIMDTFAALALATEPPHWSVMKRQPRKSTEFIVTKDIGKQILAVASLFLIVLIGLLIYMLKNGDLAGNISVYELSIFFTVFVMLQFWNLFNARCLGTTRSAFHGLMDNKWFMLIVGTIIVSQILIVQFGGHAFRTVPLSLRDWIIIVASTSLVLWAGEILRLIRRLRGGKKFVE